MGRALGCAGDWVDLSEAGIAAVCGPDVGSCAVSVERKEVIAVPIATRERIKRMDDIFG